jgi:hypothetical protein
MEFLENIQNGYMVPERLPVGRQKEAVIKYLATPGRH